MNMNQPIYKIIAVLLCITLVATTLPTDALALRPAAYVTNTNGKSAVYPALPDELDAYRARIKSILVSLRPKLEEGEELPAKKFEKHVMELCEREGIEYKRINLGPIRTVFYSFGNIIDGLADIEKEKDSLVCGLFGIVFLFLIPSVISDLDLDDKKIEKLQIKITGKTAFLGPAAGFILTLLLLRIRFLPIVFFVPFLTGIIVNIMSAYIMQNTALEHELRHGYIHIMLNKLIKENIINKIPEEAAELFEPDIDPAMRAFAKINIEEIKCLEDEMIELILEHRKKEAQEKTAEGQNQSAAKPINVHDDALAKKLTAQDKPDSSEDSSRSQAKQSSAEISKEIKIKRDIIYNIQSAA
ncbi:MAG: hypothetical protein ABH843_00455 [Candidatus Omnitrophota bacterium]